MSGIPTIQCVFKRICQEVQKDMANKLNQSSEDLEWGVQVETLLFYAMVGHKPVGVCRNFMMLSIHQKFSTYINKELYSKPIWDHLDSMYDMAALHESEIIPFPNEEVDFELPVEFDKLAVEKFGVSLPHTEADDGDLKDISSANKATKKLGPNKMKSSGTPLPGTKTNSPMASTSKNVKSSFGARNEQKYSQSELFLSFKTSKVKRSSSPMSVKSTRSDYSTRENSPEFSAVPKKSQKYERSGSPALTKKSKVEGNTSTTPLKKAIKQEPSDIPTRKVKQEVSSKKSKPNTPEQSTKKITKSDSVSGVRKQAESIPKKSSGDSSSNKASKTDPKSSSVSKGVKVDDNDSASQSGSKKASLPRSESLERKRKRPKPDDSVKKSRPEKRRRT